MDYIYNFNEFYLKKNEFAICNAYFLETFAGDFIILK